MPGKIETLDEGIFCKECGWFEEQDCLAPDGPGQRCTGCGCPRSKHVIASIITEGETP